jgi:hypothetical protein
MPRSLVESSVEVRFWIVASIPVAVLLLSTTISLVAGQEAAATPAGAAATPTTPASPVASRPPEVWTQLGLDGSLEAR